VAIDIPKSLDELPVSAPRFVGRAVPRVEDPGLVSGRTEFIDNVNDALAPLGVRANEVPAAPNRIWNLIREAREKSAGA